jgi:BlaI family transcriptional regulator, penicillinase repressor
MAKTSGTASRQLTHASRRERQCLDVLFERGQATVSEVQDRLVDPPSYSAVRATLNTLVEKGFAETRQDGPRYVYLPTIPADTARVDAVKHLVTTFFGGSAEEAVVALLQMSDTKVSRDTIEKLNRKVQAARKEGR